MYSRSLADRLIDAAPRLTASERQIATHLEQSDFSVAFTSSALLSREIGVSESTLVRFAQTLGFGNYQELQRAVQGDIQDRLLKPTPERHSAELGHLGGLWRETFDSAAYNLAYDAESIPPDVVAQVTRLLADKRRILTIGNRASAAAAIFLGYCLRLVRPNVLTVNEALGAPFDPLLDVNEDDCVVAISLSRSARTTADMVRVCRERSATVVAISDSALNAVASQSDINIIVRSMSPGYVQSYASVFVLIQALCFATASLLADSATGRLRTLEAIFEQVGTFAPAYEVGR